MKHAKRNEYILKRLILLNVKSIQEGLLQVLNYGGINANQRRCSDMFLPNVKESDYLLGNVVEKIMVKMKPLSIMDLAVDFCKKNKVDSTSCKVFVNNIDFNVRQKELWDFFEHFGKVLNVHIVKDKKTRRSKGFAFVVFSSPFDAQKALKGKKYELRLNGRVMQVLPAVKKKKNEKIQDDTEEAKMKLKEATEYFINDKRKNDLHGEKVSVRESNCQSIDTLCDDLLLEIFSYMDLRSRVRIELVCKRWYNMAIQSWSQVKHITFKNLFTLRHPLASLTDKIFISILNKNCINLKSIDLSASPYLITISSLSKLANTCPNLEEINLSYVPLKKDSAKILGKNLTKLKKIKMSRCQNVGEKGFWWLFKNQIRLEELEITETQRLAGNCIYMLPSTVTAINFESCSELTDGGLKYLASRCPNILRLNLSFCVRISDGGLGLLLEKCCNITELKLKGLGRNVTGLSFIKNLKYLVDLDISRNPIVDDDLLHQVGNSCKELQKLNIEACHGNSITANGINSLCLCDNLKELNISYIVSITDECVNNLAIEGKLRKLIIRSSPEISDQCAANCIKYLDLVMLDLSGCFYITDQLAQFINANNTANRSSDRMQIILGGTQVTGEGVKMLQEKLESSIITMQNFQVGNLRNDRDSTLVRPFFPESSDEEEEEETEPDLIVLKPDIELDIKEDYPCFDEDGERLWETPSCSDFKDEQLNTDSVVKSVVNHVLLPTPSIEDNFNQHDMTLSVRDILSPERMLDLNVASSLTTKNKLDIEEEENWDNELEEGRVWTMPSDSFEGFGSFHNDMGDDFLENDDRSRLELIG